MLDVGSFGLARGGAYATEQSAAGAPQAQVVLEVALYRLHPSAAAGASEHVLQFPRFGGLLLGRQKRHPSNRFRLVHRERGLSDIQVSGLLGSQYRVVQDLADQQYLYCLRTDERMRRVQQVVLDWI